MQGRNLSRGFLLVCSFCFQRFSTIYTGSQDTSVITTPGFCPVVRSTFGTLDEKWICKKFASAKYDAKLWKLRKIWGKDCNGHICLLNNPCFLVCKLNVLFTISPSDLLLSFFFFLPPSSFPRSRASYFS